MEIWKLILLLMFLLRSCKELWFSRNTFIQYSQQMYLLCTVTTQFVQKKGWLSRQTHANYFVFLSSVIENAAWKPTSSYSKLLPALISECSESASAQRYHYLGIFTMLSWCQQQQATISTWHLFLVKVSTESSSALLRSFNAINMYLSDLEFAVCSTQMISTEEKYY